MYFLEVANNNDLLEDLLLVDKRANQEIRSSSIIHTVNGNDSNFGS